jgi:CHAD domain-containing protein
MPRKTRKKVDFPLLDRLDELMSKLGPLAKAALDDFDPEAIHQARVATRRLSAAARLMEPVLSRRHRKPWVSGLKKLRRRLGPLRDADVLISRLESPAKGGKSTPAADWLRAYLEQKRQAVREEVRQKDAGSRSLRRLADWPAVRAEVAEAREAVDTLLAESLHLQVDAFAEQADQLASADEKSPTDDRPNPHDLRIAGKALRYTLEMAELEGHSPGVVVLRQFKRMQQLLGDWHDQVVLGDEALRAVAEAELLHFDAGLAQSVIELARQAAKRSAVELSAFARLWRQQGGTIVQRIREAFPLTHPSPDAARLVDVASGTPAATTVLVIDDAPPPEPALTIPPDLLIESRTDHDRLGSATPAGPGADD